MGVWQGGWAVVGSDYWEEKGKKVTSGPTELSSVWFHSSRNVIYPLGFHELSL